MRKEKRNSYFDIDAYSMSLSVTHDTKKSILNNPEFSRTPSVKETSFERSQSTPSLNPLQA